MGTFSSRFADDEDASSGRPECYGDPDYYDITNDVCRQCRFKGTCRLKVGALDREQRRVHSPAPHTATAVPTTAATAYRNRRPEPVYAPPTEESTFFSALAWNVSLDAATASFETIASAFARIPREGYPSLRKSRK
jgi:hypothetical protein